ncbi:MAG: ABC transporter permease subunit [Actinobacteria bacterium]|nr:ABC transporter permease subunit [Actinomycetota bacterium]MSW25636.1 ABC transporter permease subunit [Actinomycetota bacterium]MSW33368.1 ABC transporter permease subunit [Actinomycetota bacterium]MSX30392.1 ABC transporter permease subunit [Actinomycetota bacterium]MSX51474.1 ABC transporter permease subunit [Actinomycetota bacterium]
MSVFFMLRFTAGDPARIRGNLFSTNEVLDEYRRQFGTDRTVFQQFATFLNGVIHGSLGNSFRYQEPVTGLVLPALRHTMLLGMTALLISLSLAILLGTISARNPRGLVARASGVLAIFGQSAPLFWIGLLLISLFSVNLGWLPSGGFTSWKNLILPAVTLAMNILPSEMRVLSASVKAELDEDYVRTAHAFGLARWRVYFVHVLRNACLPLLTVVGNDMGMLLGGAIVAEVVFNFPGIGTLALVGLNARDYPLLQGVTIVAACTFVLVNLLVDLLYTVINPRVRLGGAT